MLVGVACLDSNLAGSHVSTLHACTAPPRTTLPSPETRLETPKCVLRSLFARYLLFVRGQFCLRPLPIRARCARDHGPVRCEGWGTLTPSLIGIPLFAAVQTNFSGLEEQAGRKAEKQKSTPPVDDYYCCCEESFQHSSAPSQQWVAVQAITSVFGGFTVAIYHHYLQLWRFRKWTRSQSGPSVSSETLP